MVTAGRCCSRGALGNVYGAGGESPAWQIGAEAVTARVPFQPVCAVFKTEQRYPPPPPSSARVVVTGEAQPAFARSARTMMAVYRCSAV